MMEGVGVGEGLSGVVQRSDKHFIASILKPLGAKAILCYCEVLTVLETSRKWKMELCERRKSIGARALAQSICLIALSNHGSLLHCSALINHAFITQCNSILFVGNVQLNSFRLTALVKCNIFLQTYEKFFLYFF